MEEYSNWVGRLTDTWCLPPSWLWAYRANILRPFNFSDYIENIVEVSDACLTCQGQV